MKTYDKWVIENVNRLDNKNVIITGATGTLGYYISYYYLLLGCNIIMAVRNIEKGNRVKEQLLKVFSQASIKVEYLDVSKFDTIDSFIDRIKDEHIDILINNAGVYYLKDANNENNMEIHFATNFFGPYLLTEKLIPKIKETKGKMIFMGSLAYTFSKIDYQDIYAKKIKDKTKIYGRTKRLIAIYSLKIKKELADSRSEH